MTPTTSVHVLEAKTPSNLWRPFAIALVAIALLLVSGVTAAPAEAQPGWANRCGPYDDVDPTSPHCANIAWLTDQDITQMGSNRNYLPAAATTRGAMTAFLFRYVHPGVEQPTCSQAPYSDVPTDHKFCGYIAWAKAEGITTGIGGGRFGPSQPTTRGAMTAFLHRTTVGGSQPTCAAAPFWDVSKNHKFCGYVTWARDNKITRGVSDGCNFAPKSATTRGAMASFIRRIESPGPTAPKCGPKPPPAPTVPVRAVVKYVIVTDGTITTDFETFKKQVQETFDDPRGWRSAGIKFERVSSGGSLTVVLANANRMTSYAPSICDSTWSCRVGRYAIINQDRWKGASPAWNNAGESLRDYRHMVVNHEVGHWLDWRHKFCGGPGQKAPVMQQQSIGLQGCKANPWPLASEKPPPRFR